MIPLLDKIYYPQNNLNITIHNNQKLKNMHVKIKESGMRLIKYKKFKKKLISY